MKRRDHFSGSDRTDLRDPRQLVFLGPGDLPRGIVTAVDQRLRARRVEAEDLEEVRQGAAVDLTLDPSPGPADGDRPGFRGRLGTGRLPRLTFRPTRRGELGAALITDELPRIERPTFGARSGPAEGSDVPKDRDGATALAQDEGEHLPAARAARRKVVDSDRHLDDPSRVPFGFRQGGRGCPLTLAESCDHHASPSRLGFIAGHGLSPAVITRDSRMERAVILCDGYFGQNTGKTANGLVRYSKRYEIVGVIDHTKAGRDAGEVLDGKPNGIPIVATLREAIDRLTPQTLVVGVATFGGYIPQEYRTILREAIENGLNIVAGLHEYLSEDPEFATLAEAHGVRLVDVRKPRPIRESKQFSDLARKLPCLRIPVLGTDGAIGTRTTALLLTDALNEKGIPATFVATGQTGLMQGSAYGVALDSIKGDFMVGELEAEIVRAHEETKSKVIIVEGQGSISHPAYVCGTRAIINASMPSGILMMHAPARKTRSFRRDVVAWPMPTVDEEIEWLQFFTRMAGGGQVVGLGINHENMTRDEVETTVRTYETKYGLPAADPLWHGCGKFVDRIQRMT